MGRVASYVSPERLSLGPLAAGAHGTPQVFTKGGIKAVKKIVYTGNHVAGDTTTINGVVFTCKASGASGELEYNVGVDLSTSLDNLITKLNACTDPLVSYATYTKTDTNTAVTSTSDFYRFADNAVVLSSTHSTVVVSSPTAGQDLAVLSLDTSTHVFNLPGSTTEEAYLYDGVEGQLKFIANVGSGTVNLKGDHLPGSTVNYAFNGTTDALILAFLGGKWRLILNDGTTAS